MKNMSDLFPGWDTLYKERGVEKVNWHYDGLDPDLEEELEKSGIKKGSFLDLGTGSGRHAVELAERGFEVTGSDISQYVLEWAGKSTVQVNFVIDNILDSQFKDEQFDYIFDRGCFHGLKPEERESYLDNVARLLKRGGRFYLKCMSSPERQQYLLFPYRFTEVEMEESFGSRFKIVRLKQTIFYGVNWPSPPAWFAVMEKL